MNLLKVLSVLLFLISMNLNGQNLIGYSEKEIKQYMAENQKNMTFQNFVNNSTFKYLKYSENDETATILFFLNEKLLCKSVRVICDKSLKTAKTKELNSLYKKVSDNEWVEIKNGKNYRIDLKEDEWSFNVSITIKE
jgi:hypothetical protein